MAVSGSPESWSKLKETRQHLEKCWKFDIDWSLYTSRVRTGMSFCMIVHRIIKCNNSKKVKSYYTPGMLLEFARTLLNNEW